MNNHKQQAEQLYQALLRRQQTWSRKSLDDWASEFANLHSSASSKRIQRTLDWYCSEGCGAVFVPLIGGAEGFRSKFEQIDAARKRLKGQQLRYLDDLIAFKIQERHSGSTAQKQYAIVMQKGQQRIQFVDDLAHGRAKLPKPNAASRNGHKANGKLTKTEKQLLSNWLIVSREAMWQLIFDSQSFQNEFTRRLKDESPKLNRYLKTLNSSF